MKYKIGDIFDAKRDKAIHYAQITKITDIYVTYFWLKDKYEFTMTHNSFKHALLREYKLLELSEKEKLVLKVKYS